MYQNYILCIIIVLYLFSNCCYVNGSVPYTTISREFYIRPLSSNIKYAYEAFEIPKYTKEVNVTILVVAPKNSQKPCVGSTFYFAFKHGSIPLVNPFNDTERAEIAIPDSPDQFFYTYPADHAGKQVTLTITSPRIGLWYIVGYSLPFSSEFCVDFSFIYIHCEYLPFSGNIPLSSPSSLHVELESRVQKLFSINPASDVLRMRIGLVEADTLLPLVASPGEPCPVTLGVGVNRISSGSLYPDCQFEVTKLEGSASPVYVLVRNPNTTVDYNITFVVSEVEVCRKAANVSAVMAGGSFGCVVNMLLNRQSMPDDFRFFFTNYNFIVVDNKVIFPLGIAYALPFEIKPFVDQGGSLELIIELFPSPISINRNNTTYGLTRNLTAYACISQFLPSTQGLLNTTPTFQTWRNTCPYMIISRLTEPLSKGTRQSLYMPFPAAGTWYYTMAVECQSDEPSYCTPNNAIFGASVLAGIKSNKCVGGSCANNGVCEQIGFRSIFITRCDCKNNFRGIDCSIAIPGVYQLRDILLLTISNLAFLPAIVVACRRRLFIPMASYCYTMFFSTVYHMCDTGYSLSMCMFKETALQFCDFYGATMSIWITLVSMSMLPLSLAAVLYVLMALLIVIAVNLSMYSVTLYAVPIAIGFFIIFICWTLWMLARRHIFPPLHYYVTGLIPGAFFSLLGLSMFAAGSEKDYGLFHSIWHMSIGFSLVFVLPDPVRWTDPRTKFGVASLHEMWCWRRFRGNTPGENENDEGGGEVAPIEPDEDEEGVGVIARGGRVGYEEPVRLKRGDVLRQGLTVIKNSVLRRCKSSCGTESVPSTDISSVSATPPITPPINTTSVPNSSASAPPPVSPPPSYQDVIVTNVETDDEVVPPKN